MATDRAQFPLYPAVAVPLPQGIPTEGPADHPEGPPSRDYTYENHYNLPSTSAHHQMPPPSNSRQSPSRYTPNATELYIQAQQQQQQPPLPQPPAIRRRNEAHFVCPVPGCGSTFTRRFNLRGHLRSHTEERPYVCDWPGCKKGFARQHDCKRHQALHAAKSQSNVCQGCKKTFSRLDALNRHLRSDGGAECRASNPKFAAGMSDDPAPALSSSGGGGQGPSREHALQ
ncbi:unnamed protein product [Cyclocybe aegerita]|uniref:C2H2-type domain-containing protein n=1 Tax=Cyclocybe aegerita TaxID=1973307 RepID=A0A8S0VQZ5_CYCAE|nr:unnamed protein product [Cyclocybe aegerita]